MKLIIPIVILLGGLTVLIAFGSGGTVAGIEAGKFASIIALSSMAIWIGAGQFYRESISSNLRNVLLWAGIGLILGTGYAYRFELEDVKDRFVAALIPGSSVSQTASDGTRQVLVTRGSNRQFLIDGETSSGRLTFLVDTGASSTVLTAGSASAIGLNLDELRFSQIVSTANGQTRAALTRLPDLKIGSIERQNVEVLVAQPGDLSTNLLGMSFLNTLSGFEVSEDRLILKD